MSINLRLSKENTIIIFGGLVLILYALFILTGWWFKLSFVNKLRDVYLLTSFNTALCFLLSGVGILFTLFFNRWGRWIQIGIGCLLFLFAGSIFIQNLLNLNFGVDQLFVPVWIDNPGTAPGRMAPSSSVAFTLFGINLILLNRKERAYYVFNYISLVLIAFIGILGITSYLLRVDSIFLWYSLTRITLGASLAFVLLSICFFIILKEKRSLQQELVLNPAKKIGFLSGIILTIVALGAGLAGFGIVMKQYEKYLKETLQSSLEEKAAVVEGEIQNVATELDAIINSMLFSRAIQTQDDDLLKNLVDFFLAQGFSGVRMADQNHNLIVNEGRFATQSGAPIHIESPKSLLVTSGSDFFIQMSKPIEVNSQHKGEITIEWPLPKVSHLFKLAHESNIEFLICYHNKPRHVYCLSSQNLAGFEVPVDTVKAVKSAKPNNIDYLKSAPIFDREKRHILVSYSVLDKLGLSLVHKTNMAQVLKPVFKPLRVVLPIVILSIAVGMFLLYWRVIPLVRRIVESEKKANLQQQQLQESEAYTKAVIENIGEGIISIDEKGFIESCTEAVSEIFGYSVDEILHKNIVHLMPPAYQDQNLKKLMPFLKNRSKHIAKGTIELEGLHKDGTIFPLELSIRETFIQGRRVFTGILHNLSYRKKAEAKFKSLLEGAPDPLVILNDQSEILMANAKVEKLFGYDKNELIGQKVEMLMPERYRHNTKYYQGYFINPLVQEENSDLGLYALHKDGHEFPVEVSLSPIEAGGEVLVLGGIRDISERKRIEKMKNEFISVVSHELRTPLTSIHGSISLLIGEKVGKLSEKAKQLLIIAGKNTERLIRLINDILDVEKIESGRMKLHLDVFDINELVKEAVAVNESYGSKYSVDVQIENILPPTSVYVDRDRLLQVLANLISNAVKFSPPKGKVTINILEQPDHKVRVMITDKGEGIPEEFKTTIFQKFAQADSSVTRKHEGTGLGLSISKAIIEKLGGTIDFITSPQGTTFYFDLPVWNKANNNPSSI